MHRINGFRRNRELKKYVFVLHQNQALKATDYRLCISFHESEGALQCLNVDFKKSILKSWLPFYSMLKYSIMLVID